MGVGATEAWERAGGRVSVSRSPRSRARRIRALATSLLALLAVSFPPHARGADDEVPTPRARAVLVAEAPVIDGVLDDAIWSESPVYDAFTQVEPVQGAAPSQRTEMRILTDGETLYIGLRAWDDEPDRIVVNRMGRDELFFYDDHFLITLDPFLNRRSGYFFLVNPAGGRRDGTFERDVSEPNWDGIWYADARIDAEGWTAELAIPFRTLALRPGADEWGLNVSRRVRRSNEESRWADPFVQRFMINMTRAGVLEGMSVASQGVGLDVVPSMSVQGVHDELAVPDNRDKLRLEPSFDAFYRILPGLTGSVTVNTNFGQTEIDDAQVNLTRFELFFPEKRSFFLQDSGIFNFGGLESENGIPFFSRRIGLDANVEPVRLLGGGKITGRVGRFNVGLLSIQQDRNQGVDDTNLAVARVAADVFDGSTMGVLLTHGDPRSDDENLLVGGDFNLRTNRIIENRYVTGSLWLQETFSEEPGRAYGSRSTAFGGELAYPNDIVNWRLTYKEFQPGFDPALGFVNRTDIRFYDALARYRIRRTAGFARTIDFELNPDLTTNRDDEVQLVNARIVPLRLTTTWEDILEVFVYHTWERVPSAFFVAPHVGVPAGTYSTSGAYVQLDSSQARAVRVILRIGYGSLYDGEVLRGRAVVEWRPSAHLQLSAEIDERRLWNLESCFGSTAASGTCDAIASPAVVRPVDFLLHLARVRAQVNFSPDVSWSTVVQWENVTDSLTAQSRIRWIIEPGRELFFVVGQDFDASPDAFRVGETAVTAKLSWTFRF